DSLVFHYGEFRNRLHGGVPPNNEIFISPLGSSLFSECSRRLTTLEIDKNKLLFDLMQNLCSGLATHPYDLAEKGPSSEILSRTTYVDFAPVTGRVYGTATFESAEDVSADATQVLHEALEESIDSARCMLREADITLARKQME